MNLTFRELKLRPDPQCPVCGPKPTITQLIDYHQFCGMGRGETTVSEHLEISPTDYAALREAGKEHLLLDVREPFELAICQIAGNLNIPLGQLPNRLGELAAWKDKLVVAQCKSGRRSMKALETLKKHGFGNVLNLEGGILAYGQDVDPSLSAY